MSFNNSELNHARKGWDKDRQISDPTDPDYADRAEERFLRDLISLTEADQKLALESYPRPKRDKLVERLAQLKNDSGH